MSSRVANPVSKLARSIGSAARPRSQLVEGPTMPKYVELLRKHQTEPAMTLSRPLTTRHEPSPPEPFHVRLPSHAPAHPSERRTPVPIMFNPYATQEAEAPFSKTQPTKQASSPEVVYVASKSARDGEDQPKWSDIEKFSVDPVTGS